MTTEFIQPIWNKSLNRYQNKLTGRILSWATACPMLRSVGGALVDFGGEVAPVQYLGGRVLRVWPTGGGNIAAVTRAISGTPAEVLFRTGDIANASVPYLDPVLGRQRIYVTMPRGMEYNEDIFQERLMRRLVGLLKDGYGELTEIPEVLEEEIEWDITTQYREGEYLGGDYARFEG